MNRKIIKAIKLLGFSALLATACQSVIATEIVFGNVQNHQEGRLIVTPTMANRLERQQAKILAQFQKQNSDYLNNKQLQLAELTEMLSYILIMAQPQPLASVNGEIYSNL
ncbi:MAG: hypothetical protein COW84_05305 [Gammaproteobacteria bacterium CG22_combo_CG10-13_8_21_14_all_40_8]|nr:MAG: hypothetical protein COW84_05305 [Gammaproteobacteria bacterium CG22_combo_CG10-13_8_21_14_all_40_8]